MNSSRRTPSDIRSRTLRGLHDAVSIAVFFAAAMAGSVLAASEALEDSSSSAAIVIRDTAELGDASERAQ
jgi:hypothetical protein